MQDILQHLDSATPGFDTNHVTTSLAILRFANQSLSAYEAHFARYDLSQGRFTTLMLLFHQPDGCWTPATLAQACNVRRATMTGLLEVLEKSDWTIRAPHPADGRSSEIRLTASGRTRLQAILPDHFQRLSAAFQGLNAQDHADLTTLMRSFASHIARLSPAATKPSAKDNRK